MLTLLEGDFEPRLLAIADHDGLDRLARLTAVEHEHEVLDARDLAGTEAHEDVALPHSGLLRCATRAHSREEHALLARSWPAVVGDRPERRVEGPHVAL